MVIEHDPADLRTPVSLLHYSLRNASSSPQLDRTIDRIGMGSYQWTLVSLCGFGTLSLSTGSWLTPNRMVGR